jgi:hypothetical protein
MAAIFIQSVVVPPLKDRLNTQRGPKMEVTKFPHHTVAEEPLAILLRHHTMHEREWLSSIII